MSTRNEKNTSLGFWCGSAAIIIVLFIQSRILVNALDLDISKLKTECMGHTVTPDEKVIGLAKECLTELTEARKKINKSTDGIDFYLCSAACLLKKHGLIDDKTGKPNLANLANVEHLLTKAPVKARVPIKDGLQNCFKKYQNESLIDAADPNNCWGLMSFGLCGKEVFEICKQEDDDGTTTEDDEEEPTEAPETT